MTAHCFAQRESVISLCILFSLSLSPRFSQTEQLRIETIIYSSIETSNEREREGGEDDRTDSLQGKERGREGKDEKKGEGRN